MTFNFFIRKNLIFVLLCLIRINVEAINPEIFHQKLSQPTPKWITDQINHDLAPFKKELGRKFLDKLFGKENLCLVRVRVKKGILTVERSKLAKAHNIPDKIIPHLYVLHALKPLPDIDFVFTAHDALSPQVDLNAECLPIFCITKNKYDRGYILFPDWYALKGFEPQKSDILKGNQHYQWDSKTPLLFFRGSDTGIFDRSKWLSCTRPKLIALSLKHPHLINARFLPRLFHPEWLEIAKKEGFLGDCVSLENHIKYKYLMDVDGNCAATPRLPLLLHSNSIILKNTTDSMLWFYGKLEPYTHFVPVAEDLSDLLIQIQWAKTHDEECIKISRNARLLAAEIFTQESIYLYLYRLLESYAKRQGEQYYLD
jgi:Glycosyl transferase family 90